MTHGLAEIGFHCRGGVTRLSHLYQRDPLRVLFPAAAGGDPPLAVIVTTSGGLVAGDTIDISVSLTPGAAAHVTASAAEKIYRSTGPTTAISQSLSIGGGAALEYLPPETILFDGARLSRETTVEIAPGSAFLGGDIVVFGRRARGESFTKGFLREVWEVRRKGELVWGDALHLEGDVARVVDDPACFAGAAAFATMILSPPGQDPHCLLEDARAVQHAGPTGRLRAGVTATAGLVVARWLATDAALLRRAYANLLAISARRRWDCRRACRGFGTFDASEKPMNLTPREKDKLLISVAAMVAERRLKRGVKLNYPEAVALITDYVLEGARDGKSVAELMRDGGTVIRREQVMEGVPEMIDEIQVEATFPDGTKLITVHDPIR